MTARPAGRDERDAAEPFASVRSAGADVDLPGLAAGPAGQFSGEFAYLTTTGRTSGLPRTIEIWFGLDAATVYLLAGGRERAQWVRNLRRDPRVTVRLGDRDLTGRARVLEPGEDADATARRLLLEKYGRGRDLTRWGETALAVAVDLSRG